MTSPPPPTLSIAEAIANAERLCGSRPDLAVAQARAILDASPQHPQAELVLGRALRMSGDAAGARDHLADLARRQSRSAATASELASALSLTGDDRGAVAELRRAVSLKPDLVEAWHRLAELLRAAGDVDGAERAHLRGLAASDGDPALRRAADALVAGRLDEAEPRLRALVAERPTDIAAIRMLAELALRLGRLADGAALLERALDLAPGFAAARELYARTLVRMNRPTDALIETDRLIAARPDDPSLALLKASILVRIGDQEGALAIYRIVLRRHPAQPTGWMSMGHVLKTLGSQREAVHAYRRAIEQAPTLGEAWWSLANLKTVGLDDSDVAAMEAALDIATEDEDRLHLEFALGKAEEDRGRYERAFRRYTAGNALRRAMLPYDPDRTRQVVRTQIEVFTRDFLDARRSGGCPSADPIFVVGLPRAGSTLVEQILASHSRVEGTMELPDLMDMAGRLSIGRDEPGRRRIESLSPAERAALGEEYIGRTRIHRREGAPLFIDKMPNNWLNVGLIRLILPNARIVDARRHPLGCCLSAWKQHFARGQAFSYDLVDVGRYYRDYVAWMAHIDEVAPGAVHRVIYEDMVRDTRGQVEALLAFLALPFEPACLAFWENDRAVRTASSEQVRRPIFGDAVEHWRRFEPWLQPLRDALGPVIDAYPAAPSGQ